jgi:hypothetical protein
VTRGDAVWLAGAVSTRLDGRSDSVTAYRSSNRDGFIGEGLRVLASGLSAGRHVVRLTAEDESGAQTTRSVAILVQEQGGEPRLEQPADRGRPLG